MSRSRIWNSFGLLDDDSTRSDKKIIAEKIDKPLGRSAGDEIKHISLRYEFRGYWQDTNEYEGIEYCNLEIDGGGHLQQVGAPSMPQEGLYVNLPFNAKFINLQVEDREEEIVNVEKLILPNPLPALEGEALIYQRDESIYNSGQWFPERSAIFSGIRNVEGYQVIHLMIYPLSYSPVNGKLRVIKAMTLDISYEFLPDMDAIVAPVNKKYKDRKIDVLGLPELDCLNEIHDSGYKDVTDLKNIDNTGDLLIVTNKVLRPAFRDYILKKSEKYMVAITELEQIREEFPNDKGVDHSIRDFLRFAVENWHTTPRYVILGGNITDIPTHWELFLGAKMPSDHFYADLHGDVCPDIVVSRFPVSEVLEMEQLCEWFVDYDESPKVWSRKVLLTTFNRQDYNDCVENVAEMISSAFQVYKRYDGQVSKEEVIQTINEGVGFINYRGHGLSTGWQSGNGLHCVDLLKLRCDSKTPQVLSIACSNNALEDKNCFGCEWIRKGKAVSFLGASVPSYTVINHEFDKCLWEGVMQKGLRCAGDIFNYGVNKLYVNIPDDDKVLHTIYAYLLLGDPTADYDR